MISRPNTLPLISHRASSAGLARHGSPPPGPAPAGGCAQPGAGVPAPARPGRATHSPGVALKGPRERTGLPGKPPWHAAGHAKSDPAGAEEPAGREIGSPRRRAGEPRRGPEPGTGHLLSLAAPSKAALAQPPRLPAKPSEAPASSPAPSEPGGRPRRAHRSTGQGMPPMPRWRGGTSSLQATAPPGQEGSEVPGEAGGGGGWHPGARPRQQGHGALFSHVEPCWQQARQLPGMERPPTHHTFPASSESTGRFPGEGAPPAAPRPIPRAPRRAQPALPLLSPTAGPGRAGKSAARCRTAAGETEARSRDGLTEPSVKAGGT